MAESSNVSFSVVQEVRNGHVFQLSNGHVSQLPNGNAAHFPNEHVSQSLRERLVAVLYQEVFANMRKVDQYHRMSHDHWRSVRSVGVGFYFKMPNVLNRFPLVVKDRLLTVFNEEVGGDVAVIREYKGIVCGLRICMRKRDKFVGELKALGDGVAETVRFMEGLQADEMDRCNRTLSLMREVEVKAREKSRLILKHSGYEINALSARLIVIVDERVNFINELDMLAPEFVPVKMDELMKQIQDKDIQNLLKL
nr:hypothetical protein [Tanacetum cinerariifolium]